MLMSCFLQIEWFWGKECVEEVHSVRSDLKDGKFECASATISKVVGSMSSVTGERCVMHSSYHRPKASTFPRESATLFCSLVSYGSGLSSGMNSIT